jgi:hypothetical protein
MSEPEYVPTMEQIWADAAAIRSEWSDAERLRRLAAAEQPVRAPAARVHLPPDVLDGLLAE